MPMRAMWAEHNHHGSASTSVKNPLSMPLHPVLYSVSLHGSVGPLHPVLEEGYTVSLSRKCRRFGAGEAGARKTIISATICFTVTARSFPASNADEAMDMAGSPTPAGYAAPMSAVAPLLIYLLTYLLTFFFFFLVHHRFP